MGRTQMVALAMAAVAVATLTWDAGRLPVVALGLTVTWGFYAFLKKWLPIGPNQGFALEVLILLPPALAYMVWLWGAGGGHFLQGVPLDDALLIGCGIGELAIYEVLLFAVVQFHHANIALPDRLDRRTFDGRWSLALANLNA